MTLLVWGALDPPTWVMPTLALVGPILIVVFTLLANRSRS